MNPKSPASLQHRQRHVPFHLFLIKIASRCNLNCTYCHMYNLADKSYISQPKIMPDDVVVAAIERIRTHVQRHNLREITLVLHGGEPLLAGEAFIQKLSDRVRERLDPVCRSHISMQTNATLITRKWLDRLTSLGITFGVSCDGTREAHDQNRVDHAGRGSYDQVARTLQLINSDSHYSSLLEGTLTVINVDSDPIEVYESLLSMQPKVIDFLLPDGTYDNPPPRLKDGVSTPYADWLIQIFDRWFNRPDTAVDIRLFKNIIGMALGGEVSTDYIGSREFGILVIETDGGMEPGSALKACGEGFTKLGLNVRHNELDDAYGCKLIQMYANGASQLCTTCKNCSIVTVCGGGYLPHRYSSTNRFDNPSIYCQDLTKLINHILMRLRATLDA
ncbi:FxsB family cyclophane-forming radical SAM/SPASM peptide maturase [Nocardia sp. NPDC050412]|uniref:FxsB family cyclophane-forming radical SAM/SPASM peptide maturase n=1 Tax=Nocardia sp. NPDC050412 TaxID=3364320 RepID=UPI003787623A